MESFFNKKDLIYEKTNSILPELCGDIINLFEKEILKKKKNLFAIKNTEMSIDIVNNKIWDKITDYLLIELKKNLTCYVNHLNNPKYFNKISNYNEKFIALQLDFNNVNMVKSIVIKKIIFDNCDNFGPENMTIEKRVVDTNCNTNLLMFVWFLNDYDGELLFWNNYNVEIKQGKIIIFPISWFFFYTELIKLNQIKYFIFGKIQQVWN